MAKPRPIILLRQSVRKVEFYRNGHRIGSFYRHKGKVGLRGSYKGEEYHRVTYWNGMVEHVLPGRHDTKVVE
jgi:hypothetical protein